MIIISNLHSGTKLSGWLRHWIWLTAHISKESDRKILRARLIALNRNQALKGRSRRFSEKVINSS